MARLVAFAGAWLPVLVWMVLILTLSGQSELPTRANPATGATIRTTYMTAKMAHLVEYGVLGGLLLRAARAPGGGLAIPTARAAVWAVVAATAFGAGDEVRQSFVPARSPSLVDVVIDATSALVVVGGWLAWQRRRADQQATRRAFE